MDMGKVTGQFAELAGRAPESLKSDMTTVANWLKVSIADKNQADADRLKADYQSAERRVRDTCSKAS